MRVAAVPLCDLNRDVYSWIVSGLAFTRTHDALIRHKVFDRALHLPGDGNRKLRVDIAAWDPVVVGTDRKAVTADIIGCRCP